MADLGTIQFDPKSGMYFTDVTDCETEDILHAIHVVAGRTGIPIEWRQHRDTRLVQIAGFYVAGLYALGFVLSLLHGRIEPRNVPVHRGAYPINLEA